MCSGTRITKEHPNFTELKSNVDRTKVQTTPKSASITQFIAIEGIHSTIFIATVSIKD